MRRRLKGWLSSPANCLVALIVGSACGRLVFAAQLGFGIDESYVLAAGRSLHFGYFDHPPVVWWLAWGAEHIGAPWHAVAIRLPFVLLFSLSTWLMFRLASDLFGQRAGLWSALLMNVVPVLSLTTGTWVLPDGPLIAALLGFACCFNRALTGNARTWGWWIGAGTSLGIAALSKYMAIPVACGAALFLFTNPAARRWRTRPQPYIAAAIAWLMFAPVMAWNARHGWSSLLFQGGRIESGRWHPFGPLTAAAGEAVFFLPWVWIPLIACLISAVRRGPGARNTWLLACLSLPTIVLFELVSLRAQVMFHWAAPATMLALPLLGDVIVRRTDRVRSIKISLVATGALVAIGALIVGTEVRFNWLPLVIEDFGLGNDPDMAAVDWTSLREALVERYLMQPNTVVAATRWSDAGKIDLVLDGAVPVICLGRDPRQYGISQPASGFIGRDILIVTQRGGPDAIGPAIRRSFDRIDALDPVTVLHGGRPGLLLHLFMGHRYRGEPP